MLIGKVMKRDSADRRSFIGRSGLLLALIALLIGVVAFPSVAEVIFKDQFEAPSPPPPGTLNDTGAVFSGDYPSGNAVGCEPAHPAGQDCYYGRDAQAAANLLQKIGASTPNNGIDNGFDYTKISNSGAVLPASATLGSGPDDWACTRDNVTGLIWEVKTTSGLRSQSHTYSWYDPNSPYEHPGIEDGGSCHASGRCDTEKFVADVNAQNLCGANDWRMPTMHELTSILDSGRASPAIDPGYFPNTPASEFWSGSPDPSYWNYTFVVLLQTGRVGSSFLYYDFRVRLVRSEQ